MEFEERQMRDEEDQVNDSDLSEESVIQMRGAHAEQRDRRGEAGPDDSGLGRYEKINPFYNKTIVSICAQSTAIVLRVPNRVLTTLAVQKHKLNPRQSPWDELVWVQNLQTCFGAMVKYSNNRQRETLNEMLSVRTFNRGEILAQEGSIL